MASRELRKKTSDADTSTETEKLAEALNELNNTMCMMSKIIMRLQQNIKEKTIEKNAECDIGASKTVH